jgi:hypothetical protein
MKFFLPAIIFLILHLNASSQITFQKVYGETNGQFITSISEDNAGNFLLSGNLNSIFENSFLIKTNPYGDTLWSKTFYDTIYSTRVINTFDRGYLFTGTHYNSGIILIKIDSVGNINWTRRLDGIDPEVESIINLSDSSYLIIGEITDSNSQNIFLIKFNSFGDTLWTRSYGNFYYTDYGTSAVETDDKGFAIGGYTVNSNTFLEDYYITKTDSNGLVEWSKSFGNNTGDFICKTMCQTIDGNFLMSGVNAVIKLDESGNMVWSRHYESGNGMFVAKTIIPTIDSCYIINGIYNNNSLTYIAILKIDSLGNVIWCKDFSTGTFPLLDFITYPLIETMDHGFAIGATRGNSTSDSCGVYFIKTDEYGNSICNQTNFQTSSFPLTLQQSNVATNIFPTALTVNPWAVQTGHLEGMIELCSSLTYNEALVENEKAFSISPNPAENHFIITTHSKSIEEIHIYNLWGQEILATYLNPVDENLSINCDHYPKGIYFVKATSDSGSIFKKIIIQ